MLIQTDFLPLLAFSFDRFWTFGYSPGQEVPSDVLETRSDYTYGGPYYSLGLTVDVSWSDTELESSFLWKVEDSNVRGDDYQIEVSSAGFVICSGSFLPF